MPNIFELILTLRAVLSTESASADALEEALLSIKRERKGVQTQQVIFRATDDMRAKLDTLSSKFNASNSDVMRVLIENAYGMLCQDRSPAAAIDESKEDLDALIKNKEAAIERIKTMQFDLETQSCNTPGE